MPITSSAKKALRSSKRKAVFNLLRKKNMEIAIKMIKKLLAQKKIEEAKKLIPLAYKAIDKASKGFTIKKGKADRKKARLMNLINKK